MWQCEQTAFMRSRLASALSWICALRSASPVALTMLWSTSVSIGTLTGGRFVHEIRSRGSCVTRPPFLEWPDIWQVAHVGAAA